MFSRPVKSRWKPAPSSSRAETRPTTRIFPSVGKAVRATMESRVLLPAPLAPMNPTVSPLRTAKLTSRSAQKTSRSACPSASLAASLRRMVRWRCSSYFLLTPTASMARGAGSAEGTGAVALDVVGEDILVVPEEEEPDGEQGQRGQPRGSEQRQARAGAVHQDRAEAFDDADQGVPHHDLREARGDGPERVEDGRQPVEDEQGAVQDVLGVPVAHVERGDRERDAADAGELHREDHWQPEQVPAGDEGLGEVEEERRHQAQL